MIWLTNAATAWVFGLIGFLAGIAWKTLRIEDQAAAETAEPLHRRQPAPWDAQGALSRYVPAPPADADEEPTP
jgi:hypothetical protein